MSVVAFAPRPGSPTDTLRAVATCRTRHPDWTIEAIRAEGGAVSIVAERRGGGFESFHPDGRRWAWVNGEGATLGHFSTLEAALATALT